jgi:hypothetical protein
MVPEDCAAANLRVTTHHSHPSQTYARRTCTNTSEQRIMQLTLLPLPPVKAPVVLRSRTQHLPKQLICHINHLSEMKTRRENCYCRHQQENLLIETADQPADAGGNAFSSYLQTIGRRMLLPRRSKRAQILPNSY